MEEESESIILKLDVNNDTTPISIELEQWLECINFSLTFYLFILLVYIIVVLNFSERATFNKLTMLPYYTLFGFCFFGMVQFSLQLEGREEDLFFTLIILNKVYFLSLAIYFQIFEWLNAWLLIRFQQ